MQSEEVMPEGVNRPNSLIRKREGGTIIIPTLANSHSMSLYEQLKIGNVPTVTVSLKC